MTPVARAAGLSENAAAALCYVLGLITGIVFLVLQPYNQNRLIRFHAFQSIFLHVACIVIIFVAGIVFRGFLVFLMPIVWLAVFALWIYMIVKAYQGSKVVLPVVGPLAEQQV